MSEKSMQLWPGGQMVRVRGDSQSPDMRVKTQDRRWRRPTKEERRKIAIEETAERLQAHEILCCQSALVDAMLKKNEFSIEDIVNEYPNPEEWDEAQCREWIEERFNDGVPSDLDAMRDFIRDNAEPAEIYEWWLVTDWLAEKLKSIGEPVIDNDYGTWWGRTCTGQGMIMDGTLQQVAALIE